jgi:hypothetical protein
MKKLFLLAFFTLALVSCEEEIPYYTVTVSSSPAEGGSVSPQGGEYQQGQTATFTATPNEFYGFAGWSGADTSTINPVSIIVDTNKSLTARFEKLDTDNDGVTDDVDQCPDTPSSEQADSNGCSVSQKEFELTITTEGEGTVTEQVVVAPTIYQGTTQVQLTAVPAEGWEFTEWTGNATGTDNPITIEIDGTKNITAVFTKKDTDGDGVPDLEDTCADTPEGEEADENGCSVSQKEFELTVTTEGEGTVTEELIVSPSIYQGTSQVKLTAVPTEGWEFTEWTGDATGSENPITIEIDGAKAIAAVFAKKDTDGDGVPDLDDLCEDTPEGEEADENGCAPSQKDTDSDGVTDDVDQCPDTPSDEEADENGCAPSQKDTDGDGVTDDLDICPNTEEGAEVDENGCSSSQADYNNNGIPDSQEGDSDNDGVIDYYDECPETTEGQVVNDNGCSVIDQVYLYSGIVSATIINSNVAGTLSFSITNNLDEAIQLESLRVYDGNSGVLRASASKSSNPDLFPSLEPGSSQSLQANFGSWIYTPIYYWNFTYQGEEYEVYKTWNYFTGQTRPLNDEEIAKIKPWDKKVVSFKEEIKN